MTDKINSYMYTKTLLAVLFDVNHEQFKYQEFRWLFDTDILEDMKKNNRRILCEWLL